MKAAKTRKVQTNKTNYMSDEAFATLKAAMENAFAFEHGQRRDLRVTRIQSAAPKGDVAERHCSNPRKAQLLSSGICDDVEHQH